MSGTSQVIVASWITEAMKAHAHNYYHHRCYPGTNFPNQQMREMPVGEVSMRATCCGCWEPIKQEGTSDVS